MALSTTGVWEKLLDLGVMSPKFGWALGILDGLVSYAQYHLRELAHTTFNASAQASDVQKFQMRSSVF